MSDQRKYWFPAKRYGWGWGIPSTWQGWMVLLGFFVLLALGALFLLPQYGAALFVIYTLFLSGVLVTVCWVKGEPPRWRWGSK